MPLRFGPRICGQSWATSSWPATNKHRSTEIQTHRSLSSKILLSEIPKCFPYFRASMFLCVIVLTRHRSFGVARVVDEHRLDLGEEVQPFFRHLALADACRLGAAEWQLRLAADGRLVDVHHAGLDVLDELH